MTLPQIMDTIALVSLVIAFIAAWVVMRQPRKK
jgi:hypothetical protein